MWLDMAIHLIQGSSVEQLFLKLTAFDAEKRRYHLSNIIEHAGTFSCIASSSPAPVEVTGIDGVSCDGAMHVWVESCIDGAIPVTIR